MRVKGKWMFEGDPIPGDWIDDPQSPDGKRFEASTYGYSKLRRLKCQSAMGRCTVQGRNCRIKAPLHRGELHHTGAHGRGMGGSWRDDRETVWTCHPCHEEEEKKRTGTRFGKEEK